MPYILAQIDFSLLKSYPIMDIT